ncbi:MAG: PfkB family carbohydrate kinase [Dehalococcoidia bacterium]
MSTRTQYNQQDDLNFLPDLLIIGPITNDHSVLDEDYKSLGGTTTYGAVLAQKLNYHPAIVTSMKRGDLPQNSLPGIPIHIAESINTTSFVNIYNSEGARKQKLIDIATKIKPSDIPKEWIKTPVVLLGPLANEVDYSCTRIFSDSIVIATIQGWLRQWDSKGMTSIPKEWDGTEVLPFVDAAIVSEHDFENLEDFEKWKTLVNILILTQGENGATIFHSGKKIHIPGWKTDAVDPTGAGDVFAAAFSLSYSKSSNVEYAGRFASCAASFSVQGVGFESMPTQKQVESRMNQHPNGKQ